MPHARSPLARSLHGSAGAVLLVLTLLAAGLAGCVLPPSLSVDNSDGGVDSPPSILAVRSDQQEFPEYSTLTFEINTSSTLNLTLLDTDLDDTLYPRVFVDYDLPTPPNPTPPRSTCTPAAGGVAAQRSSTCDLHGLCVATDLGKTHVMSVVVFDRQVLDSGTPAYQAMPPGGLSTNRTFFLICQQASP
jgi:hypothetical protein